MASYNTIKVVARFRPQNKIELASGGGTVVEFESEDTCNVQSKEGGSGSYTFDRVFSMTSRQQDIFDYSIRPTVDDILNGYNGTVFAYGQTGAGKSYTMMGSDINNPDAKGVIPRITEQIFASIMASEQNIEYTVRVSYMEIYMERIRDLLVPQNDNLPVHEEKSKGVYVKGLMEVYVGSVDEVYQILERGGMARAVAATNMNQESSRSHSIFVITVAQKNVETGSAKSGQLFLVDLAGSEKVGKTGASGQTLEEAKKINKSLSALGMVINALTDGKSSHVPYRDSKLTRILQESLGGNSRTTLIINCSPSSYNDAETISTLRFGVRAKSIKNNAKVNQELSPAELKTLLRKAQTQVSTFEEYIGKLESEVGIWRKGETVPKEQWTQSMKVGARGPLSRADTPAIQEARRGSQTPSTPRPESRMDLDRASTPSIPMDKDEREEFLRRENELQDQLADRESAVSAAEKALAEARSELKELRENSGKTTKENEKLNGEVEGLRMQVERIAFETKEATITMDSLKEANSDLTNELDDVRKELLEAKMSARETSAVIDEKEKLKKERMAQMMAGFDLGSEVFSENERSVRTSIDELDRLLELSSAGETIAPDALQSLRKMLVEVQGIVRQSDVSGGSTQSAELQAKLAEVQARYQEVLEKNLTADDVAEIKQRLATSLAQSDGASSNPDVQDALSRQQQDNARLRTELETLRKQALNGVNGSKTLHQQLADFDAMKKSLMRDLQNRCERVVELEISLDSTREQYNNVLRSANSKQQQKKLAFLERNLEQLTLVQRQLVEQNAQLKKEVAIADRKLVARGERIRGLEGLLGESQEKLMAANHRFEAQLTAVKERLEAAKQGSTRNLGGFAAGPGGPLNGGPVGGQLGSRVVKPLRGGGGAGEGGAPLVPTFAGLQAQAQAGERRSWFGRT
ncbi:kinesin-domain-containing protein [Myriangium duriaei CBS 260.36]|uniref:Kinesin-like protein n=1 Tax=Myriangium duriaei CBS 260.36 TaxID=1168546 RepID=A0A9P4MDW2_9PEZI|nr:kinesin-domain-containing protein [Myriangium duriaei CBS 260.36]